MRKEKLLKVLLAPHLSEKAAGQYIFKVARSANKHDIKAAVEELFQVTVKSVNVLNMKEDRAMPKTKPVTSSSTLCSSC